MSKRTSVGEVFVVGASEGKSLASASNVLHSSFLGALFCGSTNSDCLIFSSSITIASTAPSWSRRLFGISMQQMRFG